MKMTPKLLAVATAISFVLFGNIAGAQDGAALFQSKACVVCHGADAKTPTSGAIPKLAGQNKLYLVTQITDIKSGARNNGQTAQMQGIVANVSEEEIEAIAEYLSGL